MTLTVTLLVLLAAVLHAGWNAMVKSTGDRLVMMAWIAGSTSVIAAPIAVFVGIPGQDVWPFLLFSVCIHTGYMLLLVLAYTHGDFGQVYPLARGLAPAVVTLAGFLIVGETLSHLALIGIALIAGGIISLAWQNPNGPAAARDLRGVGYALATGAAIATYSVVDGIGGRTADTPVAYTAWLFLLHGIPITLITLIRRGRAQMLASRRVAMAGVGGAAMSMLAYGIVIWAMDHAPLGPVSALRETSVVFGALISALVLREGLGRLAVVSAIVVAAGVILLKI
ncbi:MAG: EamA family transporter [Pseudomonadales bacterium]|nr:EamA family transporter [Pseudomonadales bacterium]